MELAELLLSSSVAFKSSSGRIALSAFLSLFSIRQAVLKCSAALLVLNGASQLKLNI